MDEAFGYYGAPVNFSDLTKELNRHYFGLPYSEELNDKTYSINTIMNTYKQLRQAYCRKKYDQIK